MICPILLTDHAFEGEAEFGDLAAVPWSGSPEDLIAEEELAGMSMIGNCK